MSTNKEQGSAHKPDHLDCEHWGVGGQYVVDPVTKVRTRVGGLPIPEREGAETKETVKEEPAAAATIQDDASATGTNPSTAKKGVNRG